MQSKRWLVGCLSLSLAWGFVLITAAVLPDSAIALPAGEPWPPAAAELHVCLSGCDYASIQAAVDAAGDGTVVKVAAGTYTGVSARAGVTQVLYLSKSIIIQGGYVITNWSVPYPLTQPTTLDAQEQGRVIYITGDVDPSLEGLSITGGNATDLGGHVDEWGYTARAGSGIYIITAAATLRANQIFGNRYADYGGGLYIAAAPANVQGNQVLSNTAFLGSGVYVKDSPAVLSDNAIMSNTIGAMGGGVYLENSPATLNGNTIVANMATIGGGLYLDNSPAALNGNTIAANSALCWMARFCDFRGGSGGGLYLDNSPARLNHNTVLSNTAGNQFYRGLGGGLYLDNSAARLNYNVISGNTAQDGWYTEGQGGGLYLERGDGAVLDGNTVSANSAGSGGGGYLRESVARLSNSLVADNSAKAGSGLYVACASPHLLHTTLARNGGDGIVVAGCSDGPATMHSTAALTNTILVGHRMGISVTAGNTATLEATLWGAGAWANQADWGGNGTLVTGTRNIWGDPAFVAAEAGNYHIGLDSAALDAGVAAGVISDMDGNPRPLGKGYDIGADEFVAAGDLRWVYLPLVVVQFP